MKKDFYNKTMWEAAILLSEGITLSEIAGINNSYSKHFRKGWKAFHKEVLENQGVYKWFKEKENLD